MATRPGDYRSALLPAFRWVEGVCLYVGGGHLRAEVYGTCHHRRTHTPVSTATANRLVKAGAPLRVVRVSPQAKAA